MIFPRETAVARAVYAERGESITTEPPVIYAFDSRLHGLAVRQESGTLNSDEVVTATCGYVQYGDSWEEWACDNATKCKTIAASNFGCFPTVYTTCYASTELEYLSTYENRALYCTESVWTECVTGYKTFDNGVITGYICGVSDLAGDNSVVDNTLAAESATATTTTDSGTSSDSTSATSTSSAPSTTTSTGGGGGGGGSGPPIGAIVGGVIGGVALIALVAFGIWFMMRRKKPAATNTQPEIAPQHQNPPMSPAMTYNPMTPNPMTPNPMTPYSPQPPTYHSMSPPPDAHGAYGHQGFVPPQPSPPVTKDVRQSTATEMPTENYRTSGPPVELQ